MRKDSTTENVPVDDGLIVERASEVKQSAVRWVWPNRLARGKLMLLCGDPGLGKSQIAIDVAARISKADTFWPREASGGVGKAPTGSTLILSAEDAPNDTICPRLEAAGADLSKVHFTQWIICKVSVFSRGVRVTVAK